MLGEFMRLPAGTLVAIGSGAATATYMLVFRFPFRHGKEFEEL